MNRQKSRIVKCWGINFLGHGINVDGSLILTWPSEDRLKGKLRQVTRRNRGCSFDQLIAQVNQRMQGWLYYFRYAKMRKKLASLCSWLKHRLRCYRLKQCKRAIGIARWLQKLGIPKNRSWTTAASRRGWWRKACTPAAYEGMNNSWFADQGLIDVMNVYSRLHV